MNGQLEVTVFDGRRYQRVSRQTHGLKYTKSAPGGNKDASCNLWLDPARLPDLGPTDRLIIDDARTGRTLWDGYLNNPGEQSGEAGLGFDISALGGMVLASDRSDRFIWRDTSLDNWAAIDVGTPGTASIAAATREVGSFPDDAGTRAGKPAVFLQFPRGMFTRSGGVRAVMGYPAFKDSVHSPGAFRFFTDQGANSTDYQVSAYFGTSTGTTTPFFFRDISSGGESVAEILPRAPLASDSPLFLILWSGNNLTIPSDNIWAAYGEMAVMGQLVDRYGQWYSNPRANYVLASEVAEDILGRILTGCDPASADIDASTFPIDSLAYLDAVTAAAVFDDLMKFEPDFDWGIGEMLSSGLHRFWFRQWATDPRYILDDQVDIDLPGSDDTLCNRVAVVWTDEAGVSHVEIVTATVPELDAVGRTRDAEVVTLPDGLGSQANAQQVGAAVLQNANARKVSGTAVIDRPILDRLTGRYVMPWEVEAGWPARLQSKGVDVRITEMEYDDDQVATTATLNTPERDTDDVLTQLKRTTA